MIEKLRILLTRLFALALIAAILVSSSALEESWPLFSEILFFMGVVLVAVASMGRLWCSLYISGYKTNTLVTRGPYSLCRNPLYFFSLVGAVGVGLASETVLIPMIILLGFTAYYPFVIRSEESTLLKMHGSEFSSYRNSVPRFFPKLSRLIEPEEYVVKPKVFKRHMLDALWFIWSIGFLEIIEKLHSLNMLPTFFKIY